MTGPIVSTETDPHTGPATRSSPDDKRLAYDPPHRYVRRPAHCPAAEISPYGVEMMEDTAIRGH